jgi:hypothetical protein
MNANKTFNIEKARPTTDEIAAMAYQLHVENGRQPGRELEDWFRAEQLLAISQLEMELAKKSSVSSQKSSRSPK